MSISLTKLDLSYPHPVDYLHLKYTPLNPMELMELIESLESMKLHIPRLSDVSDYSLSL